MAQKKLFDTTEFIERPEMGEGAFLFPALAADISQILFDEIKRIDAISPFRHMLVPGGGEMSVAMTNCGAYGWVTDKSGYRYADVDVVTGHVWPAMPACIRELAHNAAALAGFESFEPDACLINRYAVGSKMGLHQDKDETDFSAPIVSVSLGLPAVFVFGGDKRADATIKVPVFSGDVIVFGGPARKKFHGVLPVKAGEDPVFGEFRYNLTLRKAK